MELYLKARHHQFRQLQKTLDCYMYSIVLNLADDGE